MSYTACKSVEQQDVGCYM